MGSAGGHDMYQDTYAPMMTDMRPHVHTFLFWAAPLDHADSLPPHK